MVPRISHYPCFPAPDYSVLIALLLETEVGSYRGSRFVQHIHMYASIRTQSGSREGRDGDWVGVGANNTNHTISGAKRRGKR